MKIKLLPLAIMVLFFASQISGAKELCFVKEIKQDEKLKLDWVWTIYSAGQNLFAVSHRDGDVNIFDISKDPRNPLFLKAIDLNSDLGCPTRHLDAFPVLSSSNVLYLAGQWTHAKGNQDSIGLSWYELDPASGESKKLGHTKFDAAMLYPSPNASLIYAGCEFSSSIKTVKLAQDRTPSELGELRGDGIKWGLAVSPDGRMACSMDSSKIGILKIGADGALSLSGAAELPEIPSFDFKFTCLAFSPDGRHFYASAGNKGQGALWIFDADTQKAELKFKEKLAEKNFFSMTCLKFSPCGEFGYFSTGPEQPGCKFGWLKRNSNDGKLGFGGKADKANPAWSLAYSPSSKTAYLGNDWSGKSFKVFSTSH